MKLQMKLTKPVKSCLRRQNKASGCLNYNSQNSFVMTRHVPAVFLQQVASAYSQFPDWLLEWDLNQFNEISYFDRGSVKDM